MKNLLILLALITSHLSLSQEITFVQDSIMNAYMESGYATKRFIPKGKTDKQGLKQGKWKDYEVKNDFVIVTYDNIPNQLFGYYLQYGEGTYVDNKRVGVWKIYILEDKTFKKIYTEEANYVDGEKQGDVNYYFSNHILALKGHFSSGIIEGDAITYFQNGQKRANIHFKEGKVEGKQTYYFQNGQIEREGVFVGDSIHGESISYYKNGGERELCNYNMGKANGSYKYYYDNGQLWIAKIYENEKLMTITGSFDKNGNPRDFGDLKNGNGTVKYYTEEGEVYSTVTYKDGVEVGEEKKLETPEWNQH